jgi:fructose-1,6-bisphosphatase II
MNELVNSDNTIFVATGVTDGGLLDGVRRKGPIIKTHSIVIRSKTGTIREITSEYNATRWL